MAAFGYFQSYSNYFWQWEEDGQIVSITGGNTIAYRDYVLELLEGLSPQGMPPFGSLLLAIIATNEGRESLDGVISTLSSHPDLPAELNHAFDFLRLLSELPRTFRRGANRKLLFQTLFSKSHNSIGAQRAQNLISSHKAAYEGGARIHPIEGNLASVLRYDLRTLALLSKQYADTDSILKKMADLTLIEEEIRLEESEATEPSPDFIGELLQHYRSFHVAALVPHLWSALNLPFHHQLPSRQPLGGFSDLTNKGDLSRLLISEFANDDLLFLSRLANNEALYINREAPPQKDNLQRLLLLDVSLKSWGTPRTLAHALMLAIARHPKTDIACRAYAVGSSYTELFFSNLPQVIEGLQQLDGALHPAEGVERFFADGMAQGNCEVIFITSAETSKLPSVQRLLHNEGNRFQYVVYTDREGRIDLYKKQQNGRRHLQHLQLPLKQLWENRPKERTGKTTAQPPEPILHYPILFPGTITYQAMLNTEDGRVFQVNAEGVAFALASQKSPLTKGWDLLYEGLPQNNSQYEIGWQEDGSPLLFCFHHPSREASIVKLKTGEKKTIPFPQWGASGSPEFFFHEGQFHFLNHYHQYTFSWEKGLVSLAHQQKPYELKIGRGHV